MQNDVPRVIDNEKDGVLSKISGKYIQAYSRIRVVNVLMYIVARIVYIS